jgi:hypothetical protein
VTYQVIVTVDDDADLAEVAGALRQAGMTLSEILDGAGVITGTADSAAIAVLSTIPGVLEVEHAHGYQLPPPDSPVQ